MVESVGIDKDRSMHPALGITSGLYIQLPSQIEILVLVVSRHLHIRLRCNSVLASPQTSHRLRLCVEI